LSKIYAKYLELKEKDKEKLYLFKSGKFYIFIADDCDAINDYVVLKKVKFTNEVYKCGFPENVLEDYLRVFKNHNLNIELVDNTNLNNNSIYDIIKNTDINKITPLEALKILENLKEIIQNEK
jgi:DNA mismatch repair ATPase MutS